MRPKSVPVPNISVSLVRPQHRCTLHFFGERGTISIPVYPTEHILDTNNILTGMPHHVGWMHLILEESCWVDASHP